MKAAVSFAVVRVLSIPVKIIMTQLKISKSSVKMIGGLSKTILKTPHSCNQAKEWAIFQDFP
jgi:hypothetical protein